MFVFGLLSAFLLKPGYHIPSTSSRYLVDRPTRLAPISMVFTGIADKMSSVMEFISGQQKISEANIEDTLKVRCFLPSCSYVEIIY